VNPNRRLTQAILAVCPWLLYTTGFALHIWARGKADNIGPAAVSPAGIEGWTFHGIPALWLQDWTPDVAPIRWLAVALHASWFYGPIVLGLFVQFRCGTKALAQLIVLDLLLLLTCDVLFTVTPTRPPWQDVELTRLVDVAYGSAGSIDSNPVAAFPSLHVAIPALLTLWFARAPDTLLRRLVPALAFWTAGVAWSVVYGGEHYMVDAIAGTVWAVCVYIVYSMLRSLANKRSVQASWRATRPPQQRQPLPAELEYDDTRAA